MRAARQIQKLASTSKSSRSTPFLLSTRQISTSSTGTSSTFIPDQPPHLSTPSSLSQPVPKLSSQGFFDASRPSISLPIRASQRESETYAELQELISKPSSSRTEIGSAKIWQKYITLSPAYRRSLPIDFLQKIFKYVIPNRKHVRELSSLPDTDGDVPKEKLYRERLKHHSSLGNKWEKRLRTITNDMMCSSREIDPQILINGIGKLAMLGDKNGCESIIREIRFRFDDKLTFRQLRIMYGYGLRSISKWLKIHSHRFTTTTTTTTSGTTVGGGNKGELELIETAESCKRLIKSMQDRNVSPNSTTAENLLNVSRLICSTNLKNDKLRKSFEELSESILVNGYNLDIINNLSFPSTVDEERRIRELKPSVKLAVVDYFGRKGELYKMLAAYDNLFPGDVDRLPGDIWSSSMSVDRLLKVEEEEDDIPTLSRMLEDEKRQRAERGWFGQRNVEEHGDEGVTSISSDPVLPQQSRTFHDYLPPIPTPFDVLPPSSLAASTDLQSINTPTTPSQRPIDGEGAVVSSILSMLSRAWSSKIKVSPNDTIYKDVSIHILRLAVRAANIEQARFIHSLKNGLSDGGVGPDLRIEGNWFKACWRTVRWTRSSSRRGTRFAKVLLNELSDVQQRLAEEREILQSLSPQDGVQEESSTSVDVILNHIKQLESLELELSEIEETIQANLRIAIERKARSNSARVVKLEERKQAQLAHRGKKRALLGMGTEKNTDKDGSWTLDTASATAPTVSPVMA